MKNWLVFRPSDLNFALNVQVLYQDRDRYDFAIVFHHRHRDGRAKYVRLLGEFLAFASLREIGETRVHIREVCKVLARAKRS